MTETVLHKLRIVFKEAAQNPHSSFYRDLYAARGFGGTTIDSTDGWSKVPFISKVDLSNSTFRERTFRPIEEEPFVYLHTSSGTSKSPIIINLRNRLFETDLRHIKKYADRLLWVYGEPWMYAFYKRAGIASVGGTVSDFAETARIAAHFRIQALQITPSQHVALTPFLAKEMDLREIRAVILWGERCSTTVYADIKRNYPNAILVPMYGNSETQGLHAIACEQLARSGKNCVHFFEDSVYPEIIDPNTGVCMEQEDIEGELVLTVLWENNIFPVVRFRTGDVTRRVKAACDCGRETFEVLGRVEFDRVPITGGQLRGDELERVMNAFAAEVHDDYSLQVYDSDSKNGVLRMELWVRPRSANVDLGTLTLHVANELRIGPDRTLQSGVDAGRYEPLAYRDISDGQENTGKKIRVVRHG